MVLLIIIPMKNGYFIGNIPNIFRHTQFGIDLVALSKLWRENARRALRLHSLWHAGTAMAAMLMPAAQEAQEVLQCPAVVGHRKPFGWEYSMDWFCWENFNRKAPWFNGKIYGFRLRFSLKPIHWNMLLWMCFGCALDVLMICIGCPFLISCLEDPKLDHSESDADGMGPPQASWLVPNC